MPTRTLFKGETVSVYDYRCAGHDSRTDERALYPEVVFVRSGAFRIESGLGRAVADPARAVLLRAGESFRVSHPGPCEDRCLVIRLNPGTLREIAGAVRPAAAEPDRSPFRGIVAACDRAQFASQRRLSARLERGEEPLAVEEEALGLVESLLASSWGAGRTTEREAAGDRDERIVALRAALASELEERKSLADLASLVGLSASRVARLFRAATGSTLHGHRVEMRLRAAVERLAGGERDLTTLALDLGFSDHAHFTNAFRRRYGVTPSGFRAGSCRLN